MTKFHSYLLIHVRLNVRFLWDRQTKFLVCQPSFYFKCFDFFSFFFLRFSLILVYTNKLILTFAMQFDSVFKFVKVFSFDSLIFYLQMHFCMWVCVVLNVWFLWCTDWIFLIFSMSDEFITLLDEFPIYFYFNRDRFRLLLYLKYYYIEE